MIKQFLDPKWEKDNRVNRDPAFTATKEAIGKLGNFYRVNGSRAVMTAPVRAAIEEKLSEAEVALEAGALPPAPVEAS